MKNNILVIVMITSVVIYPMSPLVRDPLFHCSVKESKLPFLANSIFLSPLTKVQVEIGTIVDEKNEVGCTIIGETQQKRLKRTVIGKARIYRSNKQYDQYSKVVYYKNNEDDKVEKKTLKGSIVRVKEPYIIRHIYEDELTHQEKCIPIYRVKQPDALSGSIKKIFFDQEALEKASADLTICYRDALEKGAERICYARRKSIAIPLLGSEVGFDFDVTIKIAVQAIFAFVYTNPIAYRLIHLFVKEESELEYCCSCFDEEAVIKGIYTTQ